MAIPAHVQVQRWARFSRDRTYRYALGRRLVDAQGELFGTAPSPGRTVTFLLLNPSDASATRDDPTLGRLMDFAHRWGCSDLVVVNLFALVSSDPARLREHRTRSAPDVMPRSADGARPPALSSVGGEQIATLGVAVPKYSRTCAPRKLRCFISA